MAKGRWRLTMTETREPPKVPKMEVRFLCYCEEPALVLYHLAAHGGWDVSGKQVQPPGAPLKKAMWFSTRADTVNNAYLRLGWSEHIGDQEIGKVAVWARALQKALDATMEDVSKLMELEALRDR